MTRQGGRKSSQSTVREGHVQDEYLDIFGDVATGPDAAPAVILKRGR
jgi:hypothetical protein